MVKNAFALYNKVMKKKRVVVGMSGGVDSSVTAMLLQQRGYEVIGVTFQLLSKEETIKSACCNVSSFNDAKRVADSLDIPHYVINYRDTFEKYVLNPFVDEYINGNTPNPCVECNRFIKFSILEQKAKELNADYYATGHYCDKSYSWQNDCYYLRKAKDIWKDQTYFLYMLPQTQLKKVLFPLGKFTKSEVRDLADKFGLLTAKKKESQDICFVAKNGYSNFVSKKISQNQDLSGNIVDMRGNVLGKHKGVYNYTIGQRRGLNISHTHPLFVTRINAEKKEVVVSTQDEFSSFYVKVKDFNIVNKDYQIGRLFDIKLRYRMTSSRGRLVSIDSDNVALLKFNEPQEFVTPGQSAVLYDKDRVIGGGIIFRQEFE